MSRRTWLTDDDIRDIFRDVLEEFKEELIEELKAELIQPSADILADDPLINTAEVCRRWGRSRTTLSKLIKAKRLIPAGKYKHSFTFRTSDIAKLFGPSAC